MNSIQHNRATLECLYSLGMRPQILSQKPGQYHPPPVPREGLKQRKVQIHRCAGNADVFFVQKISPCLCKSALLLFSKLFLFCSLIPPLEDFRKCETTAKARGPTLSVHSGPAVKQHGRNLLLFVFRTTVL